MEKGNGNAEYSKEGALNIAEAYHKAKQDGSNPGLVKAVEDVLGSPQKSNKPLESTPTEAKGQETETTISETTEPTRSGESETATTVLEESNAGIAHRFNNPRREKIGLGEYEPTKESFEQWDREADAAIEKGYSVEGLLHKMETDENLFNRRRNKS